MSKLLMNLEKKFGKYAISRLPLIMVVLYGLGYVMQLISPTMILYLQLNPYEIIHNLQLWRLVTWLIIPPAEENFFFTLISLYFYYSIGTAMERTWGKFYFNLYTLMGCLSIILGSFIVYGVYAYLLPEWVEYGAISTVMTFFATTFFNTYYINMSIFLAFAATFPDVEVYIFFVLPIKVKILGFVYVGVLLYDAFKTISQLGWFFGWAQLFVIIVSLLNFGIFFLLTRRILGNVKVVVRKKKNEIKKTVPIMKPVAETRHVCAICGQTSTDNADLTFRFCSKCNGNYEYCQNHLFSHVHKQ